MNKIRIAVLGAGGLGKAAVRIIAQKKELMLVGICDSQGYAYSEEGLKLPPFAESSIEKGENPPFIPPLVKGGGGGFNCLEKSSDSIGELIKFKDGIDGIFVALPNLPNEFIPSVAERFIEAGYKGVFTDALKRTRAVEILLGLDEKMRMREVVYITGCGATPGLLTASAVLAAQSYVEVEDVKIWWGVGIENWEAYRATIREDIAHLPGYDIEKAKAMSDEEVEKLLARSDGKLELHEMEHADDILLERAGVVDSRDKVEVGGIMDTRSAKKPVSTTMTLTGTTFEGKRSSHKFILGDETSMPANVVGPALGYMKRALWLKERNIYGAFGSTEFMPMVVK